MDEDVTETLERDPDGAREVYLPGLREDQPASALEPPDRALRQGRRANPCTLQDTDKTPSAVDFH